MLAYEKKIKYTDRKQTNIVSISIHIKFNRANTADYSADTTKISNQLSIHHKYSTTPVLPKTDD